MKTVAMLLAGGAGTRLSVLTETRAKPAVPFAGKFRIIDFTLSNCVNSGIYTVGVLLQYRPHSLTNHIGVGKAWDLDRSRGGVRMLPPYQGREGQHWFGGTADAILQNIDFLHEQGADQVLILSGDHIYRMDIRQMVDFHLANRADVTIAALPVPLRDARGFGVIAADAEGRIEAFQEKPANPSPMPGNPDQAYASMGNYIFSTQVLLDALEEAKRNGENDFGGHVLPRLLRTHRLFAYDFATNEIPGIKAYEQKVYWRDVGTLDAYFDAHKDVLGAEPVFDMFNPQWPIYSSGYQGPVARVLGGELRNSLLAAAVIIHEGCRISNSIIRREAVIEEDVELEDCIIMDYVRVCRGARLRRVIVDRHNHIAPGDRIGFDPEADRQRFTVTEGGITVIPAGRVSFFARDHQGTLRRSYSE